MASPASNPRSGGVFLFLLALAAAGCAPRQAARAAPLPVEALSGTYELVSIGRKPLPAREHQAVYYAGRVTLNADRSYIGEIDAETCTRENVCTRQIFRVDGEWEVLPDGTLSLHSEEEEEPLPGEEVPRIEADGREIRYYTPTGNAASYVYRRR
jgi:hypothetical protein